MSVIFSVGVSGAASRVSERSFLGLLRSGAYRLVVNEGLADGVSLVLRDGGSVVNEFGSELVGRVVMGRLLLQGTVLNCGLVSGRVLGLGEWVV